MDAVFKALADPSRRKLLDELRKENGQMLSELCEHLDMTRQAVTKHLVLLEKANLIAVVWRGREKLHYLNPMPLHEIYERWIGKYERHRLQALSDLKKVSNKPKPRKSNMMKKDQFVYVTYIRTTPERLWKALTEPEFTRKFWCNTTQESEWKPGSSWKIMAPDGMLTDSGEVLEIEPNRRLVLKWRNEFRPELKAEGYSRLTYQLEKEGKSVKLTVIHEIEKEDSKFIQAVSTGWPHILASLKSLLETGESLEETREWPREACK
jgi:uncharacterized protein YndB with AHSA1/START domain